MVQFNISSPYIIFFYFLCTLAVSNYPITYMYVDSFYNHFTFIACNAFGFKLVSAGTDCKRQILTSNVDPRIEMLNIYNGRGPIT